MESKLSVGNILLSPLLLPFRVAHQAPIMYDNLVHNYDAETPASKNDKTRRVKPVDVTFVEERLVNYQCMQFTFDEAEFARVHEGLSRRVKAWAKRNFKNEAAIKIYRASKMAEVLKAVHTTPLHKLLKGSDSVFFIFKTERRVFALLDHYVCDGGVLFDIIKTVAKLNVDPPPFPTYRYVPLISDALTAEYVMRNGLSYWKYPTQIKQCQPNIETSMKRITKAEMGGKWNRWNNFGECILNIFERFEGDAGALGQPFYTVDSARAPLVHEVPAYLNVFMTVGIKTDVAFGNNRIGGIMVTVRRPDHHLRRKYRREYIASVFEAECTKNFTDAVVSYDLLRGFDMTLLRELGSTKMDVVLTSFKLPHLCESIFGGFLGSYEKPLMYVSSGACDDAAALSYSTNWF